MTAPVSSSQSVGIQDPVDLSRASFDAPRSSASYINRDYASGYSASAKSSNDGHVSLLDLDFSIEDIPLVGDFLAMVSDLFSSPNEAASREQPATQISSYQPVPEYTGRLSQSATPEQLAEIGDLGDVGPVHNGTASNGVGAMDLSSFLPDIADIVAAPVNLLADDAGVGGEASEEQGLLAAGEKPSISGLASHPSNLLPAETLQLLQERYLSQLSKES